MFNLTKEERIVLIYFGAILILGTGINYACKRSPILKDAINFLNSNRVYSKIDINHASIEELIKIPRIGPATAKRIISFREENGDFKNLKQLKSIHGIGDSTYSTIIKYLKDL